MAGPVTDTISWDDLIEPDRIRGSLYTDPAIYAAELERIWYRTWVYVGHESEVPEPNDYVLKSIGPQPVIMSRDKTGRIHLLHNRCSHRANLICEAEKGNSSAFRCAYHGWTFANSGQLLGYPFSSGYGGRDLKAELGLGRVRAEPAGGARAAARMARPAAGPAPPTPRRERSHDRRRHRRGPLAGLWAHYRSLM